MDVIKKSDVLDSYNYDDYSGGEIIGMIVYGEISTIKAIPLEKIKKAREEIEYLILHKAQFLTSDCKVCIDSTAVLEIIDKLIKGGEE